LKELRAELADLDGYFQNLRRLCGIIRAIFVEGARIIIACAPSSLGRKEARKSAGSVIGWSWASNTILAIVTGSVT
jgi:hypothetical protein